MLVVDGNSIASISFYTDNLYNFINLVLSGLSKANESEVVFAFDAEGKYFRHTLNPDYKANRVSDPSRSEYVNKIRLALINSGHTVLQVPTFEADDIIATIHPNWILSKDRDLWMLIDDRVRVIDKSIVDRNIVKQKYGVWPELLKDYKIMVGDAGDNIKGVNKVGPKTALRLLEDYGSLVGVLQNLGKESAATQRSFQNADLQNLEKLVTLRRDVPLPNFEPTPFKHELLGKEMAKLL